MKDYIFTPSPIEVLEAIWARSQGDYVYLPTISQDNLWNESAPLTVKDIGPAFFSHDEFDQYFTPLKFNGKRQRHLVGMPGVIYADLDGSHRVDYGDMPPSVAIETSPGHYHAYWFLNAPVDANEWEQYAKGWTQEIKADPAGWDITQVLRVPDTMNRKRDNRVTTVRFRPEISYSLYDFPRSTVRPELERRQRPVKSIDLRSTLLEEGFAQDTLPLTARYWLTIRADELTALGKIDRSAIMWAIEKSLLSAGYTIDEVYQLMYFTSINKWKDNPQQLWAEIIKAAS